MVTNVMMVTYNRLNLTMQTLESLFQNTNSEFRLIVVDNGSTDATPDFLKDLSPKNKCIKIDYLLNNENLGIAVGRNQCLKLSNNYEYDYLSTIDNDVLFPENWLEDCISFLQKNEYFAIGLNFEKNKYPIKNLNGFEVQVKPAGNLGTACTVFDKKLHKCIGYFNTEFGLYGEEDADFFFRARQIGYKMAYLKDNGIHLGEGENDVGEYREFKTDCHKKNYNNFLKVCRDYISKKKSIYINF